MHRHAKQNFVDFQPATQPLTQILLWSALHLRMIGLGRKVIVNWEQTEELIAKKDLHFGSVKVHLLG